MLELHELRGSPYEIGFAHGSLAKRQVYASLRTYKAMFMDFAGLSWDDCKHRAGKFAQSIETFDPDILQEMKGIADGAGLLLDDILTLNFRSEILYSDTSDSEIPMDGCTAIAVLPQRAENGKLLHGQNWDWKSTQEDAMVVFRILQENKPSILMLTEGGIVGKLGMNSAGVAVTLNAMSTPGKAAGLPLHIMLRAILNSWSIVDAIELVAQKGCMCPANFLISSSCGDAFSVEVAINDYDVVYPRGGVCVHTNHFRSERLKSQYKDTLRDTTANTHIRLTRAERLLEGLDKKVGVEELKTIFRNHDNVPDSICWHNNPRLPEGKRTATVSSMIMDTSRGVLFATLGNPCVNPYQEFHLYP